MAIIQKRPSDLEQLVLSFARKSSMGLPSPIRPDILMVPLEGSFPIEEIWKELKTLDLADGWAIWNLSGNTLVEVDAKVLESTDLSGVSKHLEDGFLICYAQYSDMSQASALLYETLVSFLANLRIDDGIFALIEDKLEKISLKS